MPPEAEPKTEPTTPKTDAPASAEAPQPESGKTFTESEVNAMVTSRLAKQDKALKTQFAEEAKKATDRAKLDESERLKAEKTDLEAKATAAEARALAAERRADLTGKVADATAALKLLDPEKHLGDDGNVNVEALLADYPFLKPVAEGVKPPGSSPIDAARTRPKTKGEAGNLKDAVTDYYSQK